MVWTRARFWRVRGARHARRTQSGGTDYPVPGNPRVRALTRAIENLVSNAAKYGASDRPITVTVKRIGGRVTVEVHNHGSYLPVEQRDELFQLFARSAEQQRAGKHGWGLGLTIVRAVAESHGGSVGVDSSPDIGTTFVIDVPLDCRPFVRDPVR